MPIIVTKGLPAIERMLQEDVRMLDHVPEGVKPLRILLFNLMPQKEDAEMEYYRVFSHASCYVEIILAKMSGLTYKHTPQAYMDRYYRDFRDLEDDSYDGMIITGAPVEQLPFDEVTYWPQLLHIYEWAKTHVTSTLHICWAAQAALHAQYGIDKYWLDEKMFGIFEQTPSDLSLPIFKGFDAHFDMPHSRHTEVRIKDIEKVRELDIIARSPLSGASIIMAPEGRQFFVTGHLEYAPGRLDFEYHRDLNKGLPIHIPYHYYEEDDPQKPVHATWQHPARLFYTNWLLNYVSPSSNLFNKES